VTAKKGETSAVRTGLVVAMKSSGEEYCRVKIYPYAFRGGKQCAGADNS
jgi:hypothetical protein